MKRALPLYVILVLVLAVAACGKKREDEIAGTVQGGAPKSTFVTIGTGGITGVYYPIGGAVAHMVNAERNQYHIRCTVEATGGSVFNINAVMAGDLEFGLVQSDRQYQAIKGMAEWEQKGPQKKLRAVFSLHSESVTLIGAVDAGIKNIQDLKGMRVDIGLPGSSQLQNSMDALNAAGLDYETDLKAAQVNAAEAPGLLQEGRIDAFFYTFGHPNGVIREAVGGARKVRIVPIVGIDAMLAKYPYYAASTVPVKEYPGAQNSSDVPTFGLKCTLVTSADVPDPIVYAVTKEVFENLDTFRNLHPILSHITAKDMLHGLSAPIHPGAMKYYRAAGLM